MIILALLAYFIATLLWFYGEAYFLKEMMNGHVAAGIFYATWGLFAVPLFAFGTYYLYKYSPSWSIVQFPYWLMSIAISYAAFRSVTNTVIGWKELVSAILILIIAFLLGS